MATIAAPPSTKSIFNFPPNFPAGTVHPDWLAWFTTVRNNSLIYPAAQTGFALGWDAGGNLVNVPNTGADQTAAWTAADAVVTANFQAADVVVTNAFQAADTLIRNDYGSSAANKGTSLIVYLAPYASSVARTLVNHLGDRIGVLDFGAVPNSDSSAAFTSANAVGKPINCEGGPYKVVGVTITSPIVDTTNQIFTTDSTVTINNGLPVRPEWFGSAAGNINLAINALPTSGGVVSLRNKTYPPQNHVYGSGVATGTYWGKDNVKIVGEKMPDLANDCKSLINGTIIQGRINLFANGCEVRDVGFDCGFTVCATYNAGSDAAPWNEGFVVTYPNDTLKSASASRQGLKVHNIIGLASSPTTPGHGVILAEGVQGVTATGKVIGCYGYHGVVIKAKNITAESIEAYCNSWDGFIVKTDAQTSAIAQNIQVESVVARATGPVGWAPYATSSVGVGVVFLTGSQNIDGVQIGNCSVFGYPTGMNAQWDVTNGTISNVQIANFITDSFGVAGTTYGLSLISGANQHAPFWQIGSFTARNVSIGMVASLGYNEGVQVGVLTGTNIGVRLVEAGSYADVKIGNIYANSVGTALFHISGNAYLSVGAISKYSCPAIYQSTSGGLVPTLLNGWTQIAANDPFNVDITGGRISLRGLVLPGTTNVVGSLPFWATPATIKRFMVQGYNGTTTAAVPLTITAAGVIQVNEVAGGFANCTNWLSLEGATWTVQD